VCHAEVNAVLNKNSSDVKDCTIYVALFPCNECAKVIIQSGIKTVVYLSDEKAKKLKTIAAKKMFDAAGVTYRYWLFGIIDPLLENLKIFEQSCFFSGHIISGMKRSKLTSTILNATRWKRNCPRVSRNTRRRMKEGKMKIDSKSNYIQMYYIRIILDIVTFYINFSDRNLIPSTASFL